MKNKLLSIYYYIAIKSLNPWIRIGLHMVLAIFFNCLYNNKIQITILMDLTTQAKEIYMIELTAYVKKATVKAIMDIAASKEYLNISNNAFRDCLIYYADLWSKEDNLKKYCELYNWQSIIGNDIRLRTENEMKQILNDFFVQYLFYLENRVNENKENAFKFLLEYAKAHAGSAYRASIIATPEYITKIVESINWPQILASEKTT